MAAFRSAHVDLAREVLVNALEAGPEVWLGRLHEQVQMIRELAVSHQPPPAFSDLASKELEVQPMVGVVNEEQPPAGRLPGHVVDGIGKFAAPCAWHDGIRRPRRQTRPR
jgi:hypothetical protein